MILHSFSGQPVGSEQNIQLPFPICIHSKRTLCLLQRSHQKHSTAIIDSGGKRMDFRAREIAKYRYSIYVHASFHTVGNARVLKHAVGSEENFDHLIPIWERARR